MEIAYKIAFENGRFGKGGRAQFRNEKSLLLKKGSGADRQKEIVQDRFMKPDLIACEVSNARLLLGGVVQNIIQSEDGCSFGLEVRFKAGETCNVWIDRDPEGNGPGHLHIEKVTKGHLR